MITKKTKTIGYIIPDIQNMFFSEIAKNIEMEIVNKGYNLILCNSDDKFERDIKSILSLVNRNIDLLVFSPSSESLKHNNIDKIYNLLSAIEIPYIIVDRELSNKECNMIVNDHEYGGYIATKYLIDNGHKNIACISGPLEVSSARNRYNGYLKALTEANILVNTKFLFEGDYYYESGYRFAKEIIKDKSITAVFVSNDLMAYGVFQACREEKINVPNDLSVVGFDDLYFSQILEVPLTSVKQNISLISTKICSFIFNALKSKTEVETTHKEVIQPTLTIRNSVRKL
jgi:LacI family transcriptional regulator